MNSVMKEEIPCIPHNNTRHGSVVPDAWLGKL